MSQIAATSDSYPASVRAEALAAASRVMAGKTDPHGTGTLRLAEQFATWIATGEKRRQSR